MYGQLSIPKFEINGARPDPCGGGAPSADWVDLGITIENLSATKTFFMVSSLRHVDFDDSNRILYVCLCESGPPPALPKLLFNRSAPSMRIIHPRERLRLSISLPIRVSREPRHNGTRHEGRIFDIGGMRWFHCAVAYNDKPFHFNRFDPVQKVGDALSNWGRVIENTFDRQTAA